MDNMGLNDNYIGGLLETKGCFFIGRSKYLMFKVVAKNVLLFNEVFKYLKEEHNIGHTQTRNIYQVINRESINNIIEFMKKYTYRTDWKKFLEMENVRVTKKVKKTNCDSCGKEITPTMTTQDMKIKCKRCEMDGNKV